MQDLISGAMQFENFLWLRGWKTTTLNLWICTGRNPLLSFRVRECQDCMLDFSNKWIIFMLSFRAVFIIEFCFGWLPLIAAMKKLYYFYSFPVSLGQVDFVLGLTSTNHKARNWYPEMVMARTANNSDWSEEMKRKRQSSKNMIAAWPKQLDLQ